MKRLRTWQRHRNKVKQVPVEDRPDKPLVVSVEQFTEVQLRMHQEFQEKAIKYAGQCLQEQ